LKVLEEKKTWEIQMTVCFKPFMSNIINKNFTEEWYNWHWNCIYLEC